MNLLLLRYIVSVCHPAIQAGPANPLSHLGLDLIIFGCTLIIWGALAGIADLIERVHKEK